MEKDRRWIISNVHVILDWFLQFSYCLYKGLICTKDEQRMFSRLIIRPEFVLTIGATIIVEIVLT
jgi:hypothetical protein